MPRSSVKGWTGELNNPKLSISILASICPIIGSSTVWTPPSLGNSRILPVSATTPSNPPIQIHAGCEVNSSLGKSSVCLVTSVTIARNSIPVENEMKDATKGDST